MPTAKIPFSALTAGSPLVLLSVNTSTRAYGADGKPIENAVGEPKIEVCALDSLVHFTVTVKTLDSTLAKITEEQIGQSLKTRKYVLVELSNALASPYAARSGFGVNYSVKADSAKFVQSKPAPPMNNGGNI